MTRVFDVLELHAEKRSCATALTQGQRLEDYRQLKLRVDSFARGLLAAGVRRGDVVCMLAPPCSAFWVCFLAAASIGAPWVGMNPRYRARDYAFVLDDCRPKLVFAVSPYEGRDYSQELGGLVARGIAVIELDDCASAGAGLGPFLKAGEAVSEAALALARRAVEGSDTAAIVYTSGTTGTPKGALLSQDALVGCAAANAAWMGNSLDSTIMAAPINHVGGLNNFCMNVFFHGGNIIFLDRVRMADVLRIIEESQVRLLGLSQTTLKMLLEEESFALSKLSPCRLIMHGGSRMSPSMLEELTPLGCYMASVYGQTETCGVVLRSEKGASLDAMANSLGSPIDGVEARIVDPTTGALTATGEAGELQIRAPFVFSGYLGKPEATAQTITTDGFIRTGDLCIRRADGNYELVDRLKQMFKSGGYNIYPTEIEQAICEHPNVGLAAVIGVPDETYSEVGVAFVSPRGGASLHSDEVREFLRQRIANYKVPKVVIVLDALPLLANLKVDKHALRASYETGRTQTQ